MAGKAMTKTQVLSSLAESTGLSKGQIDDVIDAIGSLIGNELNAGNPFNVPGLMKVTTRVKAAVPAGPRTNPFTGETKMGEAKPAQTIVKVRPLKGLKDLVAAPSAEAPAAEAPAADEASADESSSF